MHQLFILIDHLFNIALHMVPWDVLWLRISVSERGHFDKLKAYLGHFFGRTMLEHSIASYQVL